ncbi:MAG: hypothetical protein GF364_04875 [Candidatus Lokiarchaeota archaeon]|nr:hypothetical protein [Candidatus Lokiarchaeota archaeon]
MQKRIKGRRLNCDTTLELASVKGNGKVILECNTVMDGNLYSVPVDFETDVSHERCRKTDRFKYMFVYILIWGLHTGD